MAFEELKKDLMEANTDIKSYLEHSEEYLKLKTFKVFMKSVTSIAHAVLIGMALLLALLFVSIAVSLAIGSALGKPVYGYLIVGAFYILLSVLFLLFRDRIDRPIIRIFSKHFFEDDL
jgi:ABC-type multidrug transport system fused ATPase/permease subunit